MTLNTQNQITISPAWSLNAIEWKKNLRDIFVFAVGAAIPVLIGFALSVLQFVPTLDWGGYGPLIGVLCGGIAQILNRYLNVIRV